MSTRSRINFKRNDGTIRSIYCHFDGYVSGVGKTLAKNYNETNLNALMDKGDLSTLGPTLDDCTAYKDRGEKNVEALLFIDEDDFRKNCPEEEYNYFYTNGDWFYWREEDQQVEIVKK